MTRSAPLSAETILGSAAPAPNSSIRFDLTIEGFRIRKLDSTRDVFHLSLSAKLPQSAADVGLEYTHR